MPTIERPGATVAYTVSGNGPPVILGHSLFCTRSMWHDVLPALEDDYTFINVELRGHGESTAEDEFTLWDLADDWAAILDKEGFPSAVAGGLSTGGMTAMRLALRAPERVRALALLDTNSRGDHGIDRLKNSALAWGYEKLGILPERLLLQALFAPQTLRDRPPYIGNLIATVKRFDRKQLGRAMRAVFRRDTVDVARIDKPTLILCGEYDAATPVRMHRQMHDEIKGSRLEIVPGAGHLTALEQPRKVAERLRWLAHYASGARRLS